MIWINYIIIFYRVIFILIKIRIDLLKGRIVRKFKYIWLIKLYNLKIVDYGFF